MHTQFGEDAIIRQVFPPGEDYGYAVDVGASDGLFLSNTLELEQRGWNVLCIEPNKAFACEKNRKLVYAVACGAENADDQDFTVVTMTDGQAYWAACSALKPDEKVMKEHEYITQAVNVVKVPVRTLDWCLEEVGFPRLDFVSIDTEGGDMDVLKGWDIAKWLPKLIIIENWSGDDRFRDYLGPHGYERTTRLGVNDIFIHQ